MDLISRLCTGALLGLRDATAFTPAAAGVEDQHQTQDGQQEGDHPTLRGGRRQRGDRGRGEGKNRCGERLSIDQNTTLKRPDAAINICSGPNAHPCVIPHRLCGGKLNTSVLHGTGRGYSGMLKEKYTKTFFIVPINVHRCVSDINGLRNIWIMAVSLPRTGKTKLW